MFSLFFNCLVIWRVILNTYVHSIPTIEYNFANPWLRACKPWHFTTTTTSPHPEIVIKINLYWSALLGILLSVFWYACDFGFDIVCRLWMNTTVFLQPSWRPKDKWVVNPSLSGIIEITFFFMIRNNFLLRNHKRGQVVLNYKKKSEPQNHTPSLLTSQKRISKEKANPLKKLTSHYLLIILDCPLRKSSENRNRGPERS